jgi:hypothetical protein
LIKAGPAIADTDGEPVAVLRASGFGCASLAYFQKV